MDHPPVLSAPQLRRKGECGCGQLIHKVQPWSRSLPWDLRRHVNALGQQLDDHQPVFEGLVTDNEPADVVLCELSIKLPHVHGGPLRLQFVGQRYELVFEFGLQSIRGSQRLVEGSNPAACGRSVDGESRAHDVKVRIPGRPRDEIRAYTAAVGIASMSIRLRVQRRTAWRCCSGRVETSSTTRAKSVSTAGTRYGLGPSTLERDLAFDDHQEVRLGS